MDNEAIAKKAAEAIMQRVNDTWPRTLNIDVLVDEIGKAIREATRPAVFDPYRNPLIGAQPAPKHYAPPPINPYVIDQHLKDYYSKPE